MARGFQSPGPEARERARLRRERERAERRADLRRRLAALVDRDGPESIWAGMLRDLDGAERSAP